MRGGYVPSLPSPEGLSATHKRVYRFLDRMQRCRPSVIEHRFEQRRLQAVRCWEKLSPHTNGRPLDGLPLSRYGVVYGLPPADPGDPRKSFLGNARKIHTHLGAVARALAARARGQRTRQFLTWSTPRLLAHQTRQLDSFRLTGPTQYGGFT